MERDHHFVETRPWGSFEQFTLNEATTVKTITVAPGKRFSLQRHAHRSEYWKVLAGDGILVLADTERALATGEEVYIPVGTSHRLTGGIHGITLLEIGFGTFDENDIERLQDDFGRAQAP